VTFTSTIEPVRLRPPAPGEPRLLAPAPDLASHLARLGHLPRHQAADLIEIVGRSGLTGRGGAGFPTARKLHAVAGGRGAKVVVANGTEGEPLSAKDKTLLVRSPHLVLDGLDAAARTVRATRRIICIERGNPSVYAALRLALVERGDDAVEVFLTPRRYITGQESALVNFLDGGSGKPTLARPFEHGVGGRPTLVDNVETLAHLGLIARFGSDWYRSAGTPSDPGTTLTSLGGALGRPGVYEIPLGTPLSHLLGHADARAIRGVLIGGYYGRWVAGSAVDRITLDRQGLAPHAAGLGCGVVAVIDKESCAVAELARVAAWYAASSAGQCGACTWGLRDLASATAAADTGRAGPAPIDDIRRWSAMVKGRGACRLPDGAAGFLESGIEVFAAEIADHQHGRCRRPDRHLLPVPGTEPWS
jgi:NADH:ubiquinone oxidoreductase subunit F (NADH-binding)